MYIDAVSEFRLQAAASSSEIPPGRRYSKHQVRLEPLNVICFATFFKGGDFMCESKAQGCNVVLVTKEKMLHEDWPRDVLDEVFALPNDASVALFLDLVSHIARTRKPHRIVALEEFDVVMAALAREHLCLPGMSSSTARTFRDKFAMAVKARDARLTARSRCGGARRNGRFRMRSEVSRRCATKGRRRRSSAVPQRKLASGARPRLGFPKNRRR